PPGPLRSTPNCINTDQEFTMATKPPAKSAPKPAAKTAATPAAAPAPKKVTTSISVNLVVNTPDQLRRIEFRLEKSIDDDGDPKWVIHFKLFERTDKATPFGEARVQLDVVVDKNLHDAAAETAEKGFNTAQEAYITGPGSKAAEDGSKLAPKKLQATLTKKDE